MITDDDIASEPESSHLHSARYAIIQAVCQPIQFTDEARCSILFAAPIQITDEARCSILLAAALG